MKRALVHAVCLATSVAAWLALPSSLWCQDQRVPATDAAAPAEVEFFERQVRPVLAERCFTCHGEKKQEAGLRLDSPSALVKGSDNGPVIDLKNPSTSRLLTAIGYEDSELQMPPDPPGKLPEAEIAAIRRWITAGAHWTADAPGAIAAADHASHWAFAPIRATAVPKVANEAWPRTAIDRFVLAILEEQGMAPAPPADRVTLLRRATFDLVGLPPDEAQIAAFANDPAPDAFAKAVDRLLESPHYGERWGRHWLDVARYADTKGYVRLAEERRFHYAFTYRDYVIRAFNDDLPFDRFIVEQLAADQLPLGDDAGALAALGFLTLGRQFTGNKHDIIDDRIDVVTRGLLGLTVTCARCHDHKYDPIPTADYYALYGVFASSEEPIVPPLIARPAGDAQTAAFQDEFQKRKQALDEYERKQYAALLDEFRARAADYLVKAVEGRVAPQQPLPKAAGEIRQLVVERWIDTIERAGERDEVFGPWHAFARLKKSEFAARAAEITTSWKSASGGSAAPRVNRAVRNRLLAEPPGSMVDVARAYGELLAQVNERWRGLVASAAAAASAAPERLADADEEQLRQVLNAPNSAVAVGMQEALWQYLYDAPINNEITKRRAAINEHLANTAQAPPRAHTLVEVAAAEEPRILVRGNPTRPGKRVPRHFLTALGQGEPRPFAAGTARLELARAIVSPNNPLTARVLVNRVWALHFGAGLVRTPSNFGLRGEAPTHPELLDFLAQHLIDEGWSIKKLHRWIMLSNVYQQASRDVADYRVRDPENRLLWKMSRRRLDFEALRDSILSAAGRLDLTLGGPSIDLASSGAKRRTLYGLIDRQGLPGMLPTFDFASPDAHSPQRYTTTVPQQALFLMNSPFLVEMAKAFAARDDVKALGNPADRVARMIGIAWGRAPSHDETKLALTFFEDDQRASASGGSLDAWEAFAQALLLSNEFAYVD